ncbi:MULTISPECIES: hypothetical protein [Mycobacteroides]|jgi:hypothetical protein|uniref:Uncharacterized protein n=2 Tax=Mycobacteroides TaxID=670516 RepID=A0AB73LHC6_MYCCH|nr:MULTISPECIES: hypothetical protein [Mycobacteroides]KRQ31301.1 hypothetical protein AOT86_01415 [Mycobacteroides sp. H072]KRQ35942.1 hypothetical protein AOT84_15695 [Mycobacteroides sp. H002]KRQ50520.1 hypothetical protein AOT85_13535 [Mycobacteroides sp. H054]KRQ72718.1 hypothetical protein AOT83_04990 [Mycobacteroides sp. H001]MBN7369451.1 hypothetical protein [Mycobacteroides abscessus subsp. abscessus]
MAQKEPASAGQWAGSLIFAGGLVGAFLAGQVVKSGGMAVGAFCLALVGLGIYLVSVVGQAAAANRERHPRPEQPIVEDYPDDDDTALPEKGIRASGEQATVPRKRGFLGSLGDGTTSLPHTNDR